MKEQFLSGQQAEFELTSISKPSKLDVRKPMSEQAEEIPVFKEPIISPTTEISLEGGEHGNPFSWFEKEVSERPLSEWSNGELEQGYLRLHGQVAVLEEGEKSFEGKEGIGEKTREYFSEILGQLERRNVDARELFVKAAKAAKEKGEKIRGIGAADEMSDEDGDVTEHSLSSFSPELREMLSQNPGLYEEVREELRKGKTPIKSSSEDVMTHLDRMKEAENLTEARRHFDIIKGYARIAGRKIIPEKLEEYEKKISDIDKIESLNEFKIEAENLGNEIKKYLYAQGKEMDVYRIDSLEDLAWLIMNHETDIWRPGGKYALMNIEKDEKGNRKEIVNRENILAWVRHKMIFYHEFTPDGEIHLFSDINIPTLYRPISLMEMVVTEPKYFKKENKMVKEILTLPESSDGTKEIEITGSVPVDDKEYNNLKEEILYEVWLFENAHNDDAGYRAVMGSDEQLSKNLVQQRYKNIWTQNENRLLRMLKMSGVQKKDEAFNKMLENENVFEMKQGMVGKAMQRSLLAYYYLADEEMFEKVLGGEGSPGRSAFYKKIVNGVFAGESERAFKKAKEDRIKKLREGGRTEWRESEVEPDLFGMNKSYFWNEIKAGGHNMDESEFDALCSGDVKNFALKAWEYKFRENYDRTKKWKGLVDGEGRPISGRFSNFNIFARPKIEQSKVSILRNAVRAAVGQSQGYLFSEIDDKIYSDAKYGESWAFAFTYFSGMSAQNDTDAIGFDKQVIVLNNKENRMRQAKGRGVYGIEDTISGIRKLGVNFWQGLRVKEDGRQNFDAMLLNILQGGADNEGEKIDLSKDIGNFVFEGNAERQYGVDHLANAYKLAAFFEKHGMNFNQFISTDPITKKILIDYDKADQIIRDGVWHDLRYAFDLPDLLWKKEIRYWVKEPAGYDEKGRPKGERVLRFKTTTLEEMMFSNEVREMNMYDRDEGGLRMDYKNGRRARNVFSWLIAKEFQWHRKWSGGQERWRSEHVALASAYFRNMPLDVEERKVMKNGKEVTQVVISAPFFSDKEWGAIEDTGDVSYNKLLFQEMGGDFSGGLIEGFGKGVGVFFKSAISGAGDL